MYVFSSLKRHSARWSLKLVQMRRRGFLRSYPEATPPGVLEDAAEVASLLRAYISALSIVALPGVPRSAFGNALLEVTPLIAAEHRKMEVEARRVLESLTQRATARKVDTT